MPITLDIKKDVQEAVKEVIEPLFKEIEILKEKITASNNELLTKKEVAKMTKKGASTIDRYVKEGKIPKPVYLGGEPRWRKTDILKFIKNLPSKKL